MYDHNNFLISRMYTRISQRKIRLLLRLLLYQVVRIRTVICTLIDSKDSYYMYAQILVGVASSFSEIKLAYTIVHGIVKKFIQLESAQKIYASRG